MDSNFLNIVKTRQSVRKYTDRPVEREKLIQCVEAARLAPSAENVQPWHFLIVDDPDLKNNLADQAFSGVFRPTLWAKKAPVLVVILATPDILANRIGKQITGIQYYLLDIGIAGEHFVLQARELGLGTCWIGWFNAKGVKKALNLPKKYRPVSILSVGYPETEHIREKKRNTIENICFFNTLS